MSQSALNKFSACRLKAATTWPYAAPAILATSVVEKPGIKNIVADKHWRLYFDPEIVEKWEMKAIVGKILFEISHLLRAHYKRFGKQLGLDPAKLKPIPDVIEYKRKVWAESTKLELIDDFDEENLTLPDGIKRHAEYKVPTKLLAEHYYARLQNDQPGQKGGGGRAGKNGQAGQQSGKGKSSGKKDEDEDEKQDPCDGSAADGCPKPWEEPSPEPSEGDGPSQETDVPGLSENEAELLRREVAKRTVEHSKNRGRVPCGMQRWAAEVTQPRLDYRRIITQKIVRAVQTIKGNKDFSYKRPSRRSPNTGVINPSLIDHQVNIAIVIDTSGSMSEKQLGEATKIVAGVIKTLPRRDAVRVLAADADVHNVQNVFCEEQIELLGGGGTDMALAIKVASELKPRPDVVLCLTDGYTGWPQGPINKVPCVAIIVNDGTKSAPEWIDQVIVPPTALKNEDCEDDE